MTSLVSVIMPAYRCEKTVEESVRSVQAQTYGNWELIIVDDGSPDGTPDVLSRLAKEDPRIRVITLSQNEGVASARNHGAEAASGEWIAFLDSDDVWLPDKLERQLSLAEEKKAVFLYTGASCINERSEKTGREFSVPDVVTYRSLLYRTDLICSTVVMRKEFFLRHPMERSDLHEDYICWLSILHEGITAHGIQEPLILYRITESSKSGNKLKSAAMMWRTYQHIGLNPLHAVWCFINYGIHGVFRYWL